MTELPPDPPTANGRVSPLSRRAFGTLCTTSLVATAGCLGIFDDDNEEKNDTAGETLSAVPADVGGVLHFDATMGEQAATRAVMDGFIRVGTELYDSEDGSGFEQLPVEFAGEVSYESGTMFFRQEETYAALVVETSEQDAALEAAREKLGDTEEESYSDVTVYATSTERPESVAPLGNERLVVGATTAVQDSIDAYNLETDPLSGPILDAYRQVDDGRMRGALEPEDDELSQIVSELNPELGEGLGLLPDPATIGLRYHTQSDETLFDFQLRMAEKGEAQNAKGLIQTVIDDGGEEVGFIDEDAVDQDLLERMSVTRNEKTVTIELSTTPEELASFFGTGIGRR